MRNKTVFISILLILFGASLYAQSVKINGEVRPRAEFRNGYKMLPPEGAEAAFAVSQRTRLNAFYGSDLFNVYLVAQDIRVWGDVKQLDMGATNMFGIHEAWGEFFFNKDKKFSMKLGRQEINYDDARILGDVRWAQQARAHDAALFKYETEKFKAHMGLAFNQKQEVLFGTVYQDIANYKAMQYLWVHRKLGNGGLSFLFLNNGVEKLSKVATETDPEEYKTIYSQTIGARYTPVLGPINLAAAVYYQMGKINNDSTNISALYFALEGQFKTSDKTSLALGFEYLSGTSEKDQIEDPLKIKSFNPLYGTNHKFNGHMDYFYVGNHVNDIGLIDIYATFRAKFAGKWGFFVTPHYFMAAADVYKSKSTEKDTNLEFNESDFEKMNSGLGIEFDLGLSYTARKDLTFTLGVSEMFGTETLGFVKGYSFYDQYNKNGSWAFLMISFKPDFYTTK